MSNQILVPSLGESVTEATVSKWLKSVGDTVDSDEPLVELETDKVNVEVPSPLAGTLASIKVKEGDTVSVGSLLGVVKEGKANVETKIKKTQLKEEEPYVPPKTIGKKKETEINFVTEESNIEGNYVNLKEPQKDLSKIAFLWTQFFSEDQKGSFTQLIANWRFSRDLENIETKNLP